MRQCSICSYTIDEPAHQHDVCSVCWARTTPEAREALRNGRRVDDSFMDSD